MEPITLKGKVYSSWQNYFQTKFSESQKFDRVDLGVKGDTNQEMYCPKNSTDKTKITIVYYGATLIEWLFENPETKGYTEQQKREYFYRYDFTPGESYGGPGLEFIEINLFAIDKILTEGLKGKEIQFFDNEKLIKSKIYIPYNENKEPFPNTIHFIKRSAWENFKDIFKPNRNEENLTTKEFELNKIFSGI